jgi:hypothetical protein
LEHLLDGRNLSTAIRTPGSPEIQYRPCSLDASGISRAISADYCNGIGKKIASVSSTTDYIGSYILKNGSLDKLLFDGGYCTFSGNTPQFHYYSLDHLGNVRVVANESGALEQAIHYYPFGGIFGDFEKFWIHI